MARSSTIHYTINIGVAEERLQELMAKIDELQESFEALDTSVREFLASSQTRVGALQAELDALRADDSVEDSKLTGLQTQVDALKNDVDSFSPPEPPA
jgi:chromosome segregation ATPase